MAVIYPEYARRFPTPALLANASDAEVSGVLRPLGLRWRTDTLKQLARVLAGREPPDDMDELRRLPGVGQYIAAAYLSLHREKRAAPIDANIVRWLCRMTGREMNGETRRERWVRALGDSLTPKRAFRAYTYAALDFTMNVCVKAPKCGECPVRRYCAYGCAGTPDEGILNGGHAR